MPILGLQHVGTAAADFDAAATRLAALGLETRDFRNNQGKGFQHDARVLLGNNCWLHVVHNWNPESRVNRFLKARGEGLEHVALLTNDVAADVRRLRELKVPIFEDTIFDANDGLEAFVFPDDAVGFTVELIQPHPRSWQYPDDACGRPVAAGLGFTRLRHVGAVVRDGEAARRRCEVLFGLQAREVRHDPDAGIEYEACIPLGNRCDLRLIETRDAQSRHARHLDAGGEGLEHLALETHSLPEDVARLRAAGVSVEYTPALGAVAVVPAAAGFTIEIHQAPA